MRIGVEGERGSGAGSMLGRQAVGREGSEELAKGVDCKKRMRLVSIVQ